MALKSEIPDVSSFITSDDLPTVPTKVSDLANDKNYISSIPSEYVTETELNAKGYLTSHQDISNLQSKTDNNLATTSKEVVGAINEVKILNDTKLNKTDANKLNCVSIDNVSLKEYILTNFTGTEKTYYLIAKTTCTDLPKASNFYITVETPGMYTYKVTAKELNDSNGIYVCTYRTISSTWTKWEKVCTTKVADVSNTTVSTNDVFTSTNDILYSVSNGMCTLNFEAGNLSYTTDINHTWAKATDDILPKSKMGVKFPLVCMPSGKSIVCTIDIDNKNLKVYGTIPSETTGIYGSVSYPVAES